MSTKIKLEKFYTTGDIVELEILPASTPNTQRQMLLRHIREGKVEALNLGGEKKPRYVIQGKNLIKYKDGLMRPGQYIRK